MRPSVAEVTYLDELEAAWQAHLAPRESDAPTVVSTFAGCGGSSLGYSMAGFRELLAVEWDDNAVETFRLNFPDVPVYHGDIAALSVEEALTLTGATVGSLDVLDGSPPCQGFSTAGKRKLDDDRNQLFREFTRLLRGLQPRAFVMENVSGMVKGKMRLIFVEILRELKACGYRVSARLLNAMYFGVPQSRPRLIFVGVRDDDVGVPSHPSPEGHVVNFWQACGDLVGDVEGDRPTGSIVRRYGAIHPRGWSTNQKLYRTVKGDTASAASLKWASWNRPCGTIVKQEIALSGIVHPDHRRYISLAEMKRVASYPDAFRFLNRGSGLECIGNSVPPLFMRAIAQHIRETILTPAATLAP